MNMDKFLRSLMLLSLMFSTATRLAAAGPTPDFLDSLLKPYFAVQTALAGDDLAGAKAGAEALVARIGESEELPEITKSAQAIAGAGNIEAARRGFKDLSDALQARLETVGSVGTSDVYVAYCPMAFGYAGARWLQTTTEILNPYFGSQMLRCGGIDKQLATAKKEDSAANCGEDMGEGAKCEEAAEGDKDVGCCAAMEDACGG